MMKKTIGLIMALLSTHYACATKERPAEATQEISPLGGETKAKSPAPTQAKQGEENLTNAKQNAASPAEKPAGKAEKADNPSPTQTKQGEENLANAKPDAASPTAKKEEKAEKTENPSSAPVKQEENPTHAKPNAAPPATKAEEGQGEKAGNPTFTPAVIIEDEINERKAQVKQEKAGQKEAFNNPKIQQVNQAGNRLLAEMIKESDNPMVSGMGVVLLLDAIADGAKGNSKTQITHWLTTQDNQPPVSVVSLLKNQDQYLTQAAALLMPQPKAIQEKYWKDLEKEGFIVAKDLNHLNQQVSQATKGKIPTTLESIDENVRLVLTHALGFSAPWKMRFDAQDTRPAPFSSLVKDKVEERQIAMMRGRVNATYLEDDHNMAVALPFEKDYLLLLAMPKGSLSEKSLTEAQRFLITQHDELLLQQSEKIQLSIPKWELKAKNNLIPLLQKENIKDIFSPENANLPQISKKNDLYVSDFKQDILINIHEEGGEAAAVTTAVLAVRSVSIEPKIPTINFNRAFAYAIVQKETGLNLVSGILNAPQPIKTTAKKGE